MERHFLILPGWLTALIYSDSDMDAEGEEVDAEGEEV
jgi:hypothetical protein